MLQVNGRKPSKTVGVLSVPTGRLGSLGKTSRSKAKPGQGILSSTVARQLAVSHMRQSSNITVISSPTISEIRRIMASNMAAHKVDKAVILVNSRLRAASRIRCCGSSLALLSWR